MEDEIFKFLHLIKLSCVELCSVVWDRAKNVFFLLQILTQNIIMIMIKSHAVQNAK